MAVAFWLKIKNLFLPKQYLLSSISVKENVKIHLAGHNPVVSLNLKISEIFQSSQTVSIKYLNHKLSIHKIPRKNGLNVYNVEHDAQSVGSYFWF